MSPFRTDFPWLQPVAPPAPAAELSDVTEATPLAVDGHASAPRLADSALTIAPPIVRAHPSKADEIG